MDPPTFNIETIKLYTITIQFLKMAMGVVSDMQALCNEEPWRLAFHSSNIMHVVISAYEIVLFLTFPFKLKSHWEKDTTMLLKDSMEVYVEYDNRMIGLQLAMKRGHRHGMRMRHDVDTGDRQILEK